MFHIFSSYLLLGKIYTHTHMRARTRHREIERGLNLDTRACICLDIYDKYALRLLSFTSNILFFATNTVHNVVRVYR